VYGADALAQAEAHACSLLLCDKGCWKAPQCKFTALVRSLQTFGAVVPVKFSLDILQKQVCAPPPRAFC
jgi:glutaredoxin-related protein